MPQDLDRSKTMHDKATTLRQSVATSGKGTTLKNQEDTLRKANQFDAAGTKAALTPTFMSHGANGNQVKSTCAVCGPHDKD